MGEGRNSAAAAAAARNAPPGALLPLSAVLRVAAARVGMEGNGLNRAHTITRVRTHKHNLAMRAAL